MCAASLHNSMGAASLHNSMGAASLHKSMGAASLHKSMGTASLRVQLSELCVAQSAHSNAVRSTRRMALLTGHGKDGAAGPVWGPSARSKAIP